MYLAVYYIFQQRLREHFFTIAISVNNCCETRNFEKYDCDIIVGEKCRSQEDSVNVCNI